MPDFSVGLLRDRLSWVLLVPLLLLSSACADLDVANPNAPDTDRFTRSPAAVAELANESVNAWWLASTHYEPYIATEGTADALTGNCCWVRFNNLEPRAPYFNADNEGDGRIAQHPWERNYAAVAGAVDALAALDAAVVFPGDAGATEAVRSAALWTIAAGNMNLALLFDSAFVNTKPAVSGRQQVLRGYQVVRDSSLAYWDQLIALTSGKSWRWEPSTLPLAAGPVTASTLNRIARTMAARTLMLSARTAAENTTTNWSRVLAYADGGITGTGVPDMDFSVTFDNDRWFSFFQMYGSDHTRFRVDQRLIHRMAPNIPARFAGLGAQPLPTAIDNRLAIANLPCDADPQPCSLGVEADFVYTGRVIGDALRGVYMQSPFWHRRYESMGRYTPVALKLGKPIVHVLAAENDLMIAEALARTGGNLARAASLVNKTHVLRGGRAPVAASAAAVLAGVEYERDVELYNTGGIALFDRRRVDGLQPGTLRHLPVPAAELTVLGKSIYTHGGAP